MLFDDVKVIDQPFCRRRDCAAASEGLDQSAIGSNKFSAVVLESGKQVGTPLLPNDSMFGSQSLRILLETFDAKDLFTDRLLVAIVGRSS